MKKTRFIQLSCEIRLFWKYW